MRLRRFALALAAPVAALAFSLVLSSIVLLVAGHSPATTFNAMWEYGLETSSIISVLDRAIPFYLAGLAVAIGFKMNLFNIGVEGQYRIAALFAAAFGAWISLPALLHVPLIILVAMLVGAAWAYIPAVLKVTRGVHEVISTIMLNYIGGALGAYLLTTYFEESEVGSLTPKTGALPASAQFPSLNPVVEAIGVDLPTGSDLRGFLPVAILVGVLFYLLVWRTRFGYDLRASGLNPSAAQASGVDPKAMVIRTMLLSGAIAGLVGMADLLGFFHRYTIDFPTGLGFTGIAVALLGRNHPFGVAVGALLFVYLDRSAQILDLRDIPREIVTIMQGIILLSVVVAYEVVRRVAQVQETRAAAEAGADMSDMAPAAVVDVGTLVPADATPHRFKRRTRRLFMALGGLVLIALVRVVTDTPELTSSGTFEAALRAAVPIGLAALGGIYAERSGIVNIGLEGMMILGTWFGAWAGWEYGPWWGVLAAVLGGALGGLLHAVATVTFDVNHIVSGVAINILGFGVARFLSSIAFTAETGGGVTQSPVVDGTLGQFNVPVLAGGDLFGWQSPDFFRWLQRKDWFLLSDAAGLLHGLTGNLSWLTVIAIALVPLSYWLLWRTRFGLRLRSVGEHPSAAESLGVGVYKMKYYGVVISGALAGLAGAYLALVSASIYKEGQTGGRGFIGLAAMIFGNRRPGGAAVGAGLFGFADGLQLRSGAAVHALLLLVAAAAGIAAVLAVMRKQTVRAAITAAVGVAFAVWYLASDSIPVEFLSVIPHIVTLVVLATATQRLRMPAADGLPYRKGQAS